jgi:RNA polymerase sigma-54 factor
LSVLIMTEAVRDAAENIIGNLDENGYLTATLEEIAESGQHTLDEVKQGLRVVQSLDPAGVGAKDVRECLLLQIESRNGRGGVAWQIVSNYLKLLETRQIKEIAKQLGRPLEHVQMALDVIRFLDPYPGLRYSGAGARQVEPDVYIFKEGDEHIIQLNDDDLPQLRLNAQYRKMLDRDQEPSKEIRNYVKDRYAAAIQLIKNIEQRKQTILKVCQSIVRRQLDFLEHGIDQLKPMMIKDVAEEIGVHPSTVSRAVASKYADTPQGVFELRYFFSEAVQGSAGSATPLLILKRRVKKMIEEEDTQHPLTDEQITARLKDEGIDVTRRTVAKYREDMKIPSTHQRRVRA